MSGSEVYGALDVARVDGPHTPERTAAAARLIADAVRFLNYASLPASGAPGINYPGDVDDVLASIAGAAIGLQQTLSQLAECLRAEQASGQLRLDQGRLHADDTGLAVAFACAWLDEAKAAARRLAETLNEARRVTAGMYLEEGG